MVSSVAHNIITFCWGVFFVIWMVSAFFTKRTVQRESVGQRFGYIIPILIGWFFIFRDHRVPYLFDLVVVPQIPIVFGTAAILAVCGLAICLWARATLGRNWSGTVTLKENHELIMRGPYRLVRHPIYTGFLSMILAVVLLHGRLAALLGFLLVVAGLWLKLRQEEDLMVRQFPDQYPVYRQHVKRLIPFIF